MEGLQWKLLDDEPRRLEVSRAIASGRLASARVLLQRNLRRDAPATDDAEIANVIDALASGKRDIERAASREELRGVEGRHTKTYFRGLAKLFARAPGHWTFSSRNRRPPRDPVNSMLSFGYTLLFHNIYGIVERVGFNPLLGILHETYRKSPALVSDLMEEFRAPIVESCVLAVIGRRVLSVEDFRFEKDPKRGVTGCFLRDQPRRRFIAAFEQTLSRRIRHPLFGITGDFRRMIHLQVLHLGFVLKCSERYRPFRIR